MKYPNELPLLKALGNLQTGQIQANKNRVATNRFLGERPDRKVQGQARLNQLPPVRQNQKQGKVFQRQGNSYKGTG